ncbi:hypothetical protein [Deinococcus cavernae]|nr:hypothetical protein [Deinococcus cavernae]
MEATIREFMPGPVEAQGRVPDALLRRYEGTGEIQTVIIAGDLLK